MLDWEWYTDTTVFKLFVHCLLCANYEDKRWRGIEVKRGSFITSYAKLASESGLTIRQVRTALDKLIETNELTKTATKGFTLINVVNYSTFQDLTMSERQTNDKRATYERQTNDKRMTKFCDKENDKVCDKVENVNKRSKMQAFSDFEQDTATKETTKFVTSERQADFGENGAKMTGERQQLKNKEIKNNIDNDNDNDNDNSADALSDQHHYLTVSLIQKGFLCKSDELFAYDCLFQELLKTNSFIEVAKACSYVVHAMNDKTSIKNKIGYFYSAVGNQLNYSSNSETAVSDENEDVHEKISEEELRELLKEV